jgi:hypothetical protein
MNKGFQQVKKYFKPDAKHEFYFFYEELKKMNAKMLVLIHKQRKNVNKILYEIFLVSKNYF